LKTPVAPVLDALKVRGIIGGFDLGRDYPELGQALLVCATETKTAADIALYADSMADIIARRHRPAPCAARTTS
jgi:glycine cleavage system P protein (glycine dehydrogenase) subunit 1